MPKKEDDKKEEPPFAGMLQKKFLEERKIFLWGQVTDESCKEITDKLRYLELTVPGKPITFYINTPGGSVTAGMAVYDTIKMITSEVSVVVIGMAASMGSILLSAPKKGNRFLYPHAKVMIHQPLIGGQITGPATDIHILAEDLEKTREEMNQILAEASGQPIEKVREDTDRDFYMNAEEAIEYGLADKVVDAI
ncbi:MAG: ATP-dependent Clp protease proteolytic subunit [Verrucomicrobiota bacterium]